MKDAILPSLEDYQDAECEVPEDGNPLDADAVIHNAIVRLEVLSDLFDKLAVTSSITLFYRVQCLRLRNSRDTKS